MPPAVVMVADVLVILSCGLIVLVYRENTFIAATIQVARNQTVISSGPDEERVLARELPGHTDYQHRVRNRLVPFVW